MLKHIYNVDSGTCIFNQALHHDQTTGKWQNMHLSTRKCVQTYLDYFFYFLNKFFNIKDFFLSLLDLPLGIKLHVHNVHYCNCNRIHLNLCMFKLGGRSLVFYYCLQFMNKTLHTRRWKCPLASYGPFFFYCDLSKT